MLGAEADRVGLQRLNGPVGSDNAILVMRSLADTGNEDFPNARRAAAAHDMATAIPPVEIADDGDALSIRRPDREMGAPGALMRHHMRAEHIPEASMGAFAKQIFIHLADNRAEAVGVVKLPAAAIGRSFQAIRLAIGYFTDEYRRHFGNGGKHYGFGWSYGAERFGARIVGDQTGMVVKPVRAEHGKRVVMRTVGYAARRFHGDQGLDQFGSGHHPLKLFAPRGIARAQKVQFARTSDQDVTECAAQTSFI